MNTTVGIGILFGGGLLLTQVQTLIVGDPPEADQTYVIAVKGWDSIQCEKGKYPHIVIIGDEKKVVSFCGGYPL